MADDIFISQLSPSGKLAGVFEFDGVTSYFYLYKMKDSEPAGVLDAIHITSRLPDFAQSDLRISWDEIDLKVGLYIRNVLWAVFDTKNKLKFGGNYRIGYSPTIPLEARLLH